MSERRWRVSIVGQDEVDPRTLLEHPQNPKIHTEEQDAVVTASLDRSGWLRRVLWNRRTGHVLDGHERIKLAIRYDEPTVPRDIADIPEEDEPLVLLTLDQSAGLAQPHPARWAELRTAVRTEDPALVDFFANFAAQQGWRLLGEESEARSPIQDVDLDDERLAGVRERWPVQAGEVWACGRHHVLCGDCLDPEVLAALLGDVKPTLVVADPPYGVSIVGKDGYVGGGEAYAIPFGGVKRDTRLRVSGGSRVKARTGHYPIEVAQQRIQRYAGAAAPGKKYAPVQGDDSPETARQAAQYCLTTYPQAVQVWWGANYYCDVVPGSSCWLVWDKETNGHFADCELAWTNHGGAVRMFTHRWNGMLRASEHERRWHPTQKPAALMAWVYEVVGSPDAVVLDPFLGSGPTLLAAEQRGQTVYGCDLSPENCSIALERWAILTGDRPHRVRES